ncbi:MAG: hypothetical protein WD022_05430 [Balneolaceae bacterium]
MERNHTKNLKMHQLLSLLTILMGIALMTFMIVVEDEPGAIPLALIIAGTGWYFFTRYKVRSQQA